MTDFLARLLRPRTPSQLARAILRRIPGARGLHAALRQLPRRLRLLSDPRRRVRRRTAADLARFLASGERLAFPIAPAPTTSILLVLFNQAPMTLACLRSIAAHAEVPAEVIIVDNASTDETARLLDRLDGARIFRNAENKHFLHAANQGAAAATGRTLLLLNNDATLRAGTLPSACRTLFAADDVGAVGGPIVLPDGRLQEAGSIIWSDGTCQGFGRGADPADGAFHFLREVDYCSGAFLLIRTAAFTALGGFDPAYAPAYYEETDLCMRLRDAGYRVMYQPDATIDHFEFASSSSTERALALQQRNHAVFRERHRATLQHFHHPPGTSPLVARLRDQIRGRILVIDDRVPYPALGAGYPRASRILQTLLDAGWFVTLYPLVVPSDDWTALAAAFSPRMEVMLGLGEAGLAAFLRQRVDYYDQVLVCRPHNMEPFLRHGGRAFAARLVYDAEAVFAEREIARFERAGTPLPPARADELRHQEMQLARAADIVLAVSAAEAALFRAAGCGDVRALGHALAPHPNPPGPERRRDLLFVGALDDDPSPNVDGLLWFTTEVMPLLDAKIGTDWRLHVVGRAAARRVQALAGPRIAVLGQVPDLAPLYASFRLFIAPMRYAGGIPHKIHESAAYGLPVVTTQLLARQLGWTKHELLAADTPETFAHACARLYDDTNLWRQLRTASHDALIRDCDEGEFTRTIANLLPAS